LPRCPSILALAALWAAAPGPARAAEPSSGTEILKTTGFWRCHFTWKTEQARRASGEAEFIRLRRASRGRYKLIKAEKVSATAPPAEGWTAREFDDGGWARARGPFYARMVRSLALLCLRGRFEVKDPAGVKALKLSLAYRGGAVVYVNGKEVARGGLPQGKLGPGTPAEPYPREAYVNPDGQLLRWVGFGDPEKYKDRFARRDRKLTAGIPGSLLKKGANVLAVEIHRAPTDETLFTAKFRHSYRYSLWSMMGLTKLKLSAPAGAAVTPNVARPEGVQVWTHPVADSLHVTDYGEPGEKPRPVRISGARGGAFSGQVVVSSKGTIQGLKVTPPALKGPGGAALPASAVEVRYALRASFGEDSNEGLKPCDGGSEVRYARGTVRFEALSADAPAEVAPGPKGGGAVQPVWITVRVPRNANPGDYSGELTVSAGGKSVAVPVKLRVADWALPEPKQFATHVGLIQSPDTLAMMYKVPMWSEKHWKLIDRSFQLSAELGNKVVYVPLLRRTYFGNEHSMVRWIKKADGSYKHDFSLVEKYLDIAVKRLGKPPVVCFICWELATGSVYMSGRHAKVGKSPLPFTVLDPATGKLTKATGPQWGEPECRAFWKPVLGGLRGVLAKRGLEKSMMVGVTGDRRPNQDTVEDLKAVAPEAPWVSASHSAPTHLHGQPIGYKTQVWGIKFPPDPAEKRYYGWKRAEYVAIFPRYIASCMGKSLQVNSPLGIYRLATESALVADLRGVGRCGADFWPVIKDKRGRKSAILARYPENSNWHGGWLKNSFPYILAPGKDGPTGAVRFEVFREGLQESEARIFIEKALTDPAKKAKLGAALAQRCQGVLDERVRAMRQAAEGWGTYMTWKWFTSPDLRDRSDKLYAAAAEAAKKLEAK